jgi:hypothetical protein
MINQKEINFTNYFTDEESSKALRPNAVFKRPENYDRALANVKKILNIKFI